MVNKIDGVTGQHPPVPNQGQRVENDQRAQGNRGTAASEAASDQVSLTSSAQLLKELNEAVNNSSGTDTSRIEALRKAITDGTYQVDAGTIADKLLDLDQQL